MPVGERTQTGAGYATPRADRETLEVPVEVCGQCPGIRITPRGILLQRLEHDGVEIAAKAAAFTRTGNRV